MEFRTTNNNRYFDWQAPKNAKLSDIVAKSNFLCSLQLLLTPYLEKSVAQHCQVANYEENTLTLIANSASWATKIRFQTPELIKKLKSEKPFSELKKIRSIIRLNIESKQLKRTPRKPMSLSARNINIIKNTAMTIQDEKLRKALEKLANKLS